MPNNAVGLMHRFASNLEKAYGAKEQGTAGTAGNAGGGKDVKTVRAELNAQITKLRSGPHTAAELKTLNDKLIETYRTEAK